MSVERRGGTGNQLGRKPLLSVSLGTGSQLYRFYDYDQVRDFVKAEREAYDWFIGLREARQEPYAEFRQRMIAAFDRMAARLDPGASDAKALAEVKAELEQLFTAVGLPPSRSPKGKLVAQTRRRHGPSAALGALAILVDELRQASGAPTSFMVGVVAASTFEQGTNPARDDAAKEALDELAGALTQTIVEVSDQTRDKIEALEGAERQHRLFAWRLALRNARRERDARQARDERSNKALENLEVTRQTYTALMEIKAPVDYWRIKASEHRSNAAGYRRGLVRFSATAGGALLLVLGGIAWKAVDLADTAGNPSPALFVMLGAVGVVVTTMVFWAARIMVRLFMSEHHLAIDADERATMAMTYLALTERKAAEEKDRAIVLASLFRPTTDGIVKDDAAPDLGPAGILSKVLERKLARHQ